MALKSKKVVLLSKIESTYGVDATPTGSANAILCINPKLTRRLEGVIWIVGHFTFTTPLIWQVSAKPHEGLLTLRAVNRI